MEFNAIIFEAGKEGKSVYLKEEDFGSVVGGLYERTPVDIQLEDAEAVIVLNEEGILIGLPYNRGFFGTFVVLKEDDMGDSYLNFTPDEIKKIKSKYDEMSNFSSKSKYLKTFFEEKQLKPEIFNYSIKGNVVNISNYNVIEQILALDMEDEIKQIESIIRKIDFANGDVNHFLEYLGNKLAENIVLNFGHE